MSSCLQLIWVVMPFVVKAMNGSDTEVGLCFMGQMGVYVVFCIVAAIAIHKLKPKKVLLTSASAQILIVCAMFLVIQAASTIILSPIMQLVVLMSSIGLITAFYWPVIMGWISTGHEGAELTKRLGLYNVTWGMANMLLPIVGGYLMEINYQVPIAAAIVMMIFCVISVSTLKKMRDKDRITIIQQAQSCEKPDPAQRQFLLMSRVALCTVFICVGIFRSQLGILYKFELGFAESIYGWSISLMCLFNVSFFYIMGKSHWWHYKKGFFAAVQALTVFCLIIIVISRNIFVQLAAAGLTGITYAAAYSSHQYYGVSGGKNRSRRMAIHEIILGTGYAVGSVLGGIISDHLGRNWPYIFGAIVISLAGLIQVIIWFALKQNDQSSSNEKTSFLTSPT